MASRGAWCPRPGRAIVAGVQPSLVEQAGGRDAIRAVLRDFYDHVFDDFMIGFLFKGADKERLIAKETELTLHALGDDVAYTGRAMRQAHAAHPIMGGHFMRRRKLLADAIARAGLPSAVRDAWLAHTDALRPDVTRDRTDECEAGAHAHRPR